MACGQAVANPVEPEDAPPTDSDLLGTMVEAHAAERLEAIPAPPAAQIAPAPVIDVGPAPAAAERSCPRCNGPCDPRAQFCRFCGLPLAAAALPEPSRPTGLLAAPALAPAPRPAPPRSAVAPSMTPACLVVIARDGSEGARYAVGESVDLGRSEGEILFADDEYVSPRHARIAARGGAYYLRDLASTNGVFVRIPCEATPNAEDGGEPAAGEKTTMRGHHRTPIEPRTEQPLRDQELFLVGQQVLKFELVKQAEEGLGAASEHGTLLFGTPVAPRYARLSQRTVEGVTRDVFHVRKAETVIGRESGDVVFTDDPFLSRRHAVIRMQATPGQPRRFTLADLGSSNGTFLRIQDETRLRHGDHFRIGQQLLRFDIAAAASGG